MGNKKEAALHGLSKKKRKALEAREAELRAELARREKKAEKKSAKAGGKKKGKAKAEPEVTVDVTPVATPAPSSAEERKAKSPKADTTAAAAATEVLAGNDTTRIAAATARAAAAEAGDDETDEQIKARVKAKRERRETLVATADGIDRNDYEAVKAYNEELATLGGGTFLTSTAEREANDKRAAGDDRPMPELIAEARGETPADLPKKLKKAAKAAVKAIETEVAKLEQQVEQVETEQGHIFAAGAAAPDHDFAKPSEAVKPDFETNGLGQYKVKRESDGKLVGYTRVTTYISGLENTSLLELWKLRTLLEGVALNDTPDERGEFRGDPVVGKMRDLMHVRDVTIAKARKADRKGKLAPGELAPIISGAEGDFKKAVNELAEQLLELGGVHEKAQKGTDLHALCEAYDLDRLDGTSKVDAIAKIEARADTTPADVADVQAYADAIERAGIRYERELIERVVVNDTLKVAGRLDRGGLVRLPGEQRGRRRVIDIKTGRINYGAGKIAQQLEMYATAEGYDLETHERTDLKLDRNKALVIHLPAGQATCSIHVVDLTLGRKGNAIIGQVRAFRNEGKKAIDDKVNLAVETAS